MSIVGAASDLGETDDGVVDADEGDVMDLLASELASEDAQVDHVFDDERDRVEYEPSEHEIAYLDYGRAGEARDDARRWVEELFEYLDSRAFQLGDAYPFEIAKGRTSIRSLERTEPRDLYLFFLCCSSLRLFDRQTQAVLTRSFEHVSAEVLAELLPSEFRTEVFGTARTGGSFEGNLYARLSQLADELRGELIASEVDLHPMDNGDNGLDLVAWRPVTDSAEGVPAFFAQCACGTGWQAKQSEASYLQRWHRFVRLVSVPTTVTFIPHMFRKPGGHWLANIEVEALLIDRLRAIRLMGQKMPSQLPHEFLAEARAYQRSTV